MLILLASLVFGAKSRSKKAQVISFTKILLILYIHVNNIYFARVLGEEEPIDKN